jgi:hypothetical protein
LQFKILVHAPLKIAQPLVSLKNFTLPVVFTASPALDGIHAPARAAAIAAADRRRMHLLLSESAAGAVLQGPHAREEMRAKQSVVKRTVGRGHGMGD